MHFSLDGQLGSNDRSRAQEILYWMDLAGVLLHVWGLAVGKRIWIERALLGMGRVGIGENEEIHKEEF